ncbi:MAG TPA: hypothetical protein VH142_01625 [Polyangiaceae bacterium]|jgi:hypothetical protein|nr:hypothetical protein [Polyangiaceae bacterium]
MGASAALTLSGCGSSSGNGPPKGGLLLDGGSTGGSSGATSAGGSTSVGGSGGATSSSSSPIGKSCLVDSDCLAGLTCVTTASDALGGGGPPGGFCSLDCSAEDSCAQYDQGSICLQTSDTAAYCFESCTIGSSDANKCHARSDMACNQPLDSTGAPASGPGYCSPTCRGDFDCKGRKCDLSSGLCVDTTAGTGKLPIGSKCTPGATVDQCTGACIQFLGVDGGSTLPICTGVCSLGQLGCDQDPNSTAAPDSACDIPVTDTATTGDSGFCAQLCDCDSQCRFPGFICQTLPSAAVSALGRSGQCTPATDSTGAALPHIATCPTGTPVADSGPPPTPEADAAADAAADAGKKKK